MTTQNCKIPLGNSHPYVKEHKFGVYVFKMHWEFEENLYQNLDSRHVNLKITVFGKTNVRVFF